MMSKNIEVLNKIFDVRFIESSHSVISEEKADMSRDIVKGGIADDDILICRLDQTENPEIRDLFPYFKGDPTNPGLKGMKCICDYAIFVDIDNSLFILLVELKKGKEVPTMQLDATVPFIDFIINRARILKHLDVNYTVRKVGITDEVGKRCTSDRGEVRYNENDYVKLYKNNRIYLKRLLH